MGEPIDPTTIPAAGPDEGCDDELKQPLPTNQPKQPKVGEDICEGLDWLDKTVIWIATGCKPVHLLGSPWA